MKPYYADDLITLYHADCLEHLDVLDQADVLVTDPPYGMAYQSNYSKYRGKTDAIAGDTTTVARDAVLNSWMRGGGAPRAGVRHLACSTPRLSQRHCLDQRKQPWYGRPVHAVGSVVGRGLRHG